jgi:signal transduction histidine kinase/CheY-like chemotaxis protein
MLEIFSLDQQRTFLRLLLSNAPLPDILVHIVQMAEGQAPGTTCVIYLHDDLFPEKLLQNPSDHIEQHRWHHPIYSRMGSSIGSIWLCQRDGSHATEPKELLKTIGQLAALAYDCSRLPAEAMERSRLAALAVRISGIQSRTVSLPRMLQQCTEALVQDLDMAFARIWLLDDAEQVLVLAASAGLSMNLHGAYSRVSISTSLKISRMVYDRQPLMTNHILRETWIKEPDWAKREGLVAYAGYPLIAEDRVVGVMAMFARQPLPEHTLEALGAIAGGLAQAIVRSEAEAETLDRVKELQALHETASLLQLDEAVPQLLQKVVLLLPAACQYPDVAAARIVFSQQVYETTGFRSTPWRQVAEFRLSNGETGSLEVVYLEARPANAEGCVLGEERRLIDSLAEMLRNYLERKHAEQALRESRDVLRRLNATLEERVKERTSQLVKKQDQLRSLAVDLSRAEECARQQLATDLHDNLAQLLALAKMKLQGDPQARASFKAFDAIKELLDEALTYTRSVMADLRPPFLSDAHDLQRAISWVVERLQRRGLQVRVQSETEPIVLQEEALTVTYQTIHELLFNVLKHAQTLEATLILRRHNDCLEAVVMDEGAGFEAQGSDVAPKEGGFGLLNVRERVELLGGRLEISSRINGGTCAKLVMPLQGHHARPHLTRTPPAQVSGRLADSFEPSGETAADMARIILADDHQMVREGLRSIIEGQPGMRVVAEASDGEMAINAVRRLRPDVIVMDINMPKMNGLEATREIKAEFPEITVIGLSTQDDVKMALAMRKAGGSGYVSKEEAAEHLVVMITEALTKRM